jgi:Tfp pilus assembly protein PilV
VTRVRRRGERGETLVELLVTIVILGSAIIALVAGVATAIASSDSHRQEATAEGVIRSFAERVQDPTDVPYVSCALVSTYPASPPGFTLPAGWPSASITAISYLQADATFGPTCPSPDLGAQQLTLQVTSPHSVHGTTETLVIVKRLP